MQRQSLNGTWQFRQVGSTEWMPATVPGGVHTDLLALGKIPDPFVGTHEKDVAWVAETNWEYRFSFIASKPEAGSHSFLVFEGLDTLAEVTLNGQKLLAADNMFRTYRLDVSDLLQGKNALHVLFRAPMPFVREAKAARPGVFESATLRKAPSHFGWDWGPVLPTIGVWKSVRLETHQQARLDDVHIQQNHQDGQVQLHLTVQVEQWGNLPLQVKVKVLDPEGQLEHEGSALVGADGTVHLSFPISGPELWWPNGYGAQPLYTFETELVSGKTVLDQRTQKIGLRTIEVKQIPDAYGRSFTFFVNGIEVFCKGSNWIPADSFPTRITASQERNLLESAVASHQNMIRVWGGGYYESDSFYDLCDELGLLVWQDLIFACNIYPVHEQAFLDSVKLELQDNLKRLRNRTCIALWCGDNEQEMGWEWWGWDTPERTHLKEAYKQFIYRLLPEWVGQQDPTRLFWPSSPSSHLPIVQANGADQGDMHYWDVWHKGAPFSAYRTQFPRFMSEFGFQSLPPMKTIDTFAGPEDHNITSEVMEHHQKSHIGNGLIVKQMLEHFKLPTSFAKLVYLSMVLQAEGVRYGVEHWRRNRHRVSGTLYWQLNDCWPVASWASLDYYGRWKALHYAAKRFYAPLLLSLEDHPERIDMHVTSDRVQDQTIEVRWSFETLSGEALSRGSLKTTALALKDTLVHNLPLQGEAGKTVLVVELWQDELLQTQVMPFSLDKHMKYDRPQIVAEVKTEGNMAELTLTSQTLARFVELDFKNADVVFSDNYLDLPAHRPRVITFELAEGWTRKDVQRNLSIQTLFGSYQLDEFPQKTLS